MTEATIFLATAIALIPIIVAFVREHPHRWPITIIALLFGWTFIGLAIALVWAVWPIKIGPATEPIERADRRLDRVQPIQWNRAQ